MSAAAAATPKLPGVTLDTDELLTHLPFLREILDGKEIARAQFDKFAEGATALRRCRAGEVVCAEGDYGSTAFFIVKGRVEVSLHNPLANVRTRRAGGGSFLTRGVARLKHMTSFLSAEGGSRDATGAEGGSGQRFIPIDAPVDLPRERPLAELGDGELFGEMTCRTFQPRSATVTCLEETFLVEMLRVVLDMLTGTREVSDEVKARTRVKAPTFKGSPTFRRLTGERYRNRTLINHLRSVPMFAGLDDAFMEELRLGAELVSVGAGQPVVTEGEPADAFYLIRTGMVKVSQALPGGEAVRTYLSRGDYFGEIGLVQADGKRVATCRALDQTDLVRIGRDLFERMLEGSPAVRVQVRLVADARLRSNAATSRPVGVDLDEFLNQGLFEAQNILLIDLDKCTRCDACVHACAEAHDGVTRLLRDGLRYDKYLVATACRSCHDPLCMTQCPVGSIRRKDSLEIQIESWCIGCGKCAELCPYGNINMHSFEVPDEKPAPPAGKVSPPPELKTRPTAAKPGPPTLATPPPARVGGPPTHSTPPPALATPPPALATPPPPTVPVKTATAKPPPAHASPAASPPPARPAKKGVKTVQKATTCDLCTELVTPSCVYACPHDAAMRVVPARYFAGEKSAEDRRRRSWLSRLFFKAEPDNRTTH